MTDIMADILYFMYSSHEVAGPCFDKCGNGGSGWAVCYLICVLSKPLTVLGVTSTVVCVVAGSRLGPVSLYNRVNLKDSADILANSAQDVPLHYELICTKLSKERKKHAVKESTV